MKFEGNERLLLSRDMRLCTVPSCIQFVIKKINGARHFEVTMSELSGAGTM